MTARFKQITERLNDDIIGDIIPVRINADMSVATLHALETIFYLRLQLAQAAWEDNEPIYEELCIDCIGQIAKALTSKYKTAESLYEKIEILERLTVIGQLIRSNDFYIAIEETYALKGLPDLTYAQRLRLEWIPNINSENDSEIVTSLLNSIPNSPFPIPNLEDAVFNMETLALISDYVTPREREAIFNRFTELVETAVASKDTKSLSILLTLSAYWNSDPHLREKLKDLTKRVKKITNLDSEPSEARIISRLHPIAAEIYSRIDKITGKYDILSA